MADPVDYKELYLVQNDVLNMIFSDESIFYLTGGTCINRFYSEKRYSDDLDLFTSDNNLFRDYIRIVFNIFDEKKIIFQTVADSKDFVRINIKEILKVDFVNDRTYYYGRTVKSENGYYLDNAINMLANKLSAIIGRDEPKDVFDIFLLSTITEFNWNDIAEIARKKELFEYDILEYRLKTFPLVLLDKLILKDQSFISIIKTNYNLMVDDIICGGNNSLFRRF